MEAVVKSRRDILNYLLDQAIEKQAMLPAMAPTGSRLVPRKPPAPTTPQPQAKQASRTKKARHQATCLPQVVERSFDKLAAGPPLQMAPTVGRPQLPPPPPQSPTPVPLNIQPPPTGGIPSPTPTVGSPIDTNPMSLASQGSMMGRTNAMRSLDENFADDMGRRLATQQKKNPGTLPAAGGLLGAAPMTRPATSALSPFDRGMPSSARPQATAGRPMTPQGVAGRPAAPAAKLPAQTKVPPSQPAGTGLAKRGSSFIDKLFA